MWDGQQIPGSPIEIMINMVDGRIIYELCDVLLMLMGAFTVRTPDLSNIQLEINQFIRIPIDCRLAGPGKLQVFSFFFELFFFIFSPFLFVLVIFTCFNLLELELTFQSFGILNLIRH